MHDFLGLFAARSRAQICAHARGDRAPDAAHRRQAQRRRALHPRAVPLRVAGPELGAHAPVGERVQHARRAPTLARCVGGARCRDVGPVRDDARRARSRDCALGYHARDDAACDGRAARCRGKGEEAAGCEVSDLFRVDRDSEEVEERDRCCSFLNEGGGGGKSCQPLCAIASEGARFLDVCLADYEI